MSNIYDIGKVVTLTASIAATSGGMIDPTSLFLTLKWPDTSCGSWGFVEFTKIATGHYSFDVNCLNQSGLYFYRWSSTGSGQGAEVNNFLVRENEGC